MRVLDERTQVKEAIQRWIERYGVDRTYAMDKRGRSVGKELMNLDQETATADDVAEIIGNNSWAHEEECGECGKRSWGIVEIGDKPDHESNTAYVCGGCLRSALLLLGNS